MESGSDMSLLAGQLGYVQLAEPARFRAGWEQAASLRLRAGDASVLADYDQHARIRGGEPEQMVDAAAATCVALTLDGTDTLLMAADHALRRELSRRIRDDLIRLGRVQPAASYQAMHDACIERETVFAAMADRADWDNATPTSSSRRCAQPNPGPLPKPSATSSP